MPHKSCFTQCELQITQSLHAIIILITAFEIHTPRCDLLHLYVEKFTLKGHRAKYIAYMASNNSYVSKKAILNFVLIKSLLVCYKEYSRHYNIAL